MVFEPLGLRQTAAATPACLNIVWPGRWSLTARGRGTRRVAWWLRQHGPGRDADSGRDGAGARVNGGRVRWGLTGGRKGPNRHAAEYAHFYLAFFFTIDWFFGHP